MAKRKERDCTKCIAYCNMLPGEGYRCGLGFEVAEELARGGGSWGIVVHPSRNACEAVKMPATKKEFVETAAKLGIEWNIDEVADPGDIY